MMKAVALITALACATIAPAQSSLAWWDVQKGSDPYLTTAYFAKQGWEVWVFGANRADTQDVELGQLFPVGKNWLVGGYAAVWPQSGKWFAIPIAIYQRDLLGGHLTLKLGQYLPLNGGPRILFSDESSLLWRARKGMSWGPILSYVQVNGNKPTARLGLTLRLTKGRTGLELSCQPAYLSGNGETRFRVGVSQGF